MFKKLVTACAAAALLGLGASAHAEAFGALEGTSWIDPADFATTDAHARFLLRTDASVGDQFFTEGTVLETATSDPTYYAAVNAPVGVLINDVTCDYRDNSQDWDIEFEWIRHTQDVTNSAGDFQSESVAAFKSNGTPGYAAAELIPTSAKTMSYQSDTTRIKHLIAVKPRGVSFAGCQVYWQRQISAAPAGSSFTDVFPDGKHESYHQGIEALVESGITKGCGETTYCPDDPVTRAQMATFLARALGLSFPQ